MEQKEFLEHMNSYQGMSEMLKTHSYEEILEQAAIIGNIPPEALEMRPMGGYSKHMTSGAYKYVLEDLIRNIAQYDWLYSKFEDDKSRLVFSNLFAYRILPANSFLNAAYDSDIPQYFDKSFVSCTCDEVFVDCGGFTGDTAEQYIRQYGEYRRIYVYEPSEENAEICRKNLSIYSVKEQLITV